MTDGVSSVQALSDNAQKQDGRDIARVGRGCGRKEEEWMRLDLDFLTVDHPGPVTGPTLGHLIWRARITSASVLSSSYKNSEAL